MSNTRLSHRSKDPSEPIDLDMTPVMNLLLILIPIMVSMAVLTQVSIIRFNLPPEGASSETPPPQENREVDITVVLSLSGFQVIGEGKKLDPIPKSEGQYNFQQLAVFLQKLKREYPATESLVLLIDQKVVYEDVIRTMDLCRENQFKNVALSGGMGS